MVFNEDYHINMLMSNKDVYIRFDKFRTGEINKLLIPGLSGSGKSTLARELAKKYNCPCIELDKFRGQVYYTDEEIKKDHPYIYKYFQTEFTKGDRHNIAKLEPEERREEFYKFIYWLLKQPERMVIEGALERLLYLDDDMRKTYPMVFKGTSMLKSMARMSWREFKREHPGRDSIDNLLWWMKWCSMYKKMTDQHNKVREKIMGDVNMNDYEEREENDLPLIMEAIGYKPHPIVFSDDDVYINYDKWKSGECTSLLVTGLSGGGKSSLSKKIAKKFNAYYVEIDVISFKISILKPHHANWEYIKEQDKYLYKYLKEHNLPPTIMQQFKNYQDIKKNTIIDKYVYWLCFERDDLDTNRVVIEGGDVAISLTNIKELSNLPIIIKGTSLAKSLFRRMNRTLDQGDDIWYILKRVFDGTYVSQYSKMYPEVDNARKAVMDQEYEELEESFLPELTFYHGSRHKLDKILPMAFSAGNKLKDPSWGVFMFRQKDLAELYALMTIMRLVCREKDIPRPRGWLEKDGFMHYRFIIVLPKEYYDIVKETVIGLSTYVYTLQVPINRQLDIIGTTGSLPEYIYSGTPKTVKREEIVIDGELFDKIITKVSMREYNRIKKDKPHRYNTVGPWVDWFVNVEERERMRNLVKEKMEKGELQPGDDLSWLKEEANSPLIMEAMGYKPQPIVFSDDDVYINYDKWKSGECTSLLVTGLSGGGKSTLSKKLAEKFNAYYVEIDVISFGLLKPQKANWNYIQENDKYLYKFLKENNLTPTLMLNFKDHPQNKKKVKILDKYIHWLCFERDDLDKNRVVIAGSDVAASLIHMKELAEFPIIIKGTSIAKSSYRKIQRTLNKGHDIRFILDHILHSNYFSMYRYRVPEINSARQAVMNQEYEEIHESFLPELTFYHGSSHKFDKVKPISFSAGNKLRDPSWAVFMLRQYDLALSYVVGNYVKEKCEENGIKYSFCAWIEKDGFMHYKPIVLADKQNFQKVKDLVRGDTVYVYTLKVPIDDKLNMIGTTTTLPEYVYSGVPKTIKRDDIVITDELLDSLVTDQIDEKEFQKIKKSKPHKINRIGSWADLFIDMDKRKEMRDKVLPKIDSGEIKPGDDLSWLKESSNIKHTFTHKELCDIYQNQMITENSAIYIPHESGNITQHIPGAYFNEEFGVWMRKPNKEELYKLRLIEAGYDPKTGKIIYNTESDDKFLEVFEADEKEWLKKVYYKSFPNIRAGAPQPVINIKGHKFRPRCEVIIIDGDKALIDPLSNRGGMGYSCPGGGIDPNESIADGAKRECEEEARVIPKDIIYTGLAWTLEFKTKSIAYFGSISFICVATKKKDYKGYVKVADRDKFVDNATWVPISNLSEPHQMAIARYKNLYLQESLGINMEFLNNEYV